MDNLQPQDGIIISLLARMVFNNGKDIRAIIVKNKKNPKSWIKGYNSCDGTKGVTEIAKIVGVKQPTATVMLKSWERSGILYNLGTSTKPLYSKLMLI
jgi:hypothetical protein